MSNNDKYFLNNQMKIVIDKLFYGDKARFGEVIGKITNPKEKMSIQAINIYYNNHRPLSNNLADTIVERLELNRKWFYTGEGMMLNEDIPKINNSNKGVPFYPLDVTASIVRSFNDIAEKPDFFIDFKPFNNCTAYFRVYGDSMYPQYCSGDIVAVEEVKYYNSINWGHAYLIITNEEANNLRAIKTIHQHIESSYIVLRSTNPKYVGDMVVNVNSIISLFKVKGKIHIEVI